MSVATGKAVFINLASKEIFNGKETDYYTMTITLDDDSVKQLAQQGVKTKEYEGNQQRKFKSYTSPKVYELNNDEFIGQVTRGSSVRIQYTLGPEHPVHGFAPYFSKIRLVELAEGESDEDF